MARGAKHHQLMFYACSSSVSLAVHVKSIPCREHAVLIITDGARPCNRDQFKFCSREVPVTLQSRERGLRHAVTQGRCSIFSCEDSSIIANTHDMLNVRCKCTRHGSSGVFDIYLQPARRPGQRGISSPCSRPTTVRCTASNDQWAGERSVNHTYQIIIESSNSRTPSVGAPIFTHLRMHLLGYALDELGGVL